MKENQRHGNMEQTDSGPNACGGKWWKEKEGIGQRTGMNEPWARTAVWGLTVGAGMAWVEEGKGRKLGQL